MTTVKARKIKPTTDNPARRSRNQKEISRGGAERRKDGPNCPLQFSAPPRLRANFFFWERDYGQQVLGVLAVQFILSRKSWQTPKWETPHGD
jgi:hypothetical protein